MAKVDLFFIDIFEKYPKQTIMNQAEKIAEEIDEIAEAIVEQDDVNLVEECWDLIQATIGLIKVKGLEKEFMEGFKNHKQKLIDRGYKLEEF